MFEFIWNLKWSFKIWKFNLNVKKNIVKCLKNYFKHGVVCIQPYHMINLTTSTWHHSTEIMNFQMWYIKLFQIQIKFLNSLDPSQLILSQTLGNPDVWRKGEGGRERKKKGYTLHTTVLMLLYLIMSFQFSFADLGNIKQWDLPHKYLTAGFFETCAMPTLTKSRNPTNCGWGVHFNHT